MPSLPFDLIGSRHPGDTGSLASTAVPARLRNHYLYQCGNDTANRFTFSRMVPGYPFLLCRSSVRGLGSKPVPGIGPSGIRVYIDLDFGGGDCIFAPVCRTRLQYSSGFPLSVCRRPQAPPALAVIPVSGKALQVGQACPSFLPESNTAAPVQRHGENDAIHGFAGFTGIGC